MIEINSTELQETTQLLREIKGILQSMGVASAQPEPAKIVTSQVDISTSSLPPVVPMAGQTITAAQAPIQSPVPQTASTVVPTVPMPQAPPPAVPLANSPTYTPAQVGQAAALFSEISKANHEQVLNLINKYGVSSLTEIPSSNLGSFVTELRGLGANI